MGICLRAHTSSWIKSCHVFQKNRMKRYTPVMCLIQENNNREIAMSVLTREPWARLEAASLFSTHEWPSILKSTSFRSEPSCRYLIQQHMLPEATCALTYLHTVLSSREVKCSLGSGCWRNALLNPPFQGLPRLWWRSPIIFIGCTFFFEYSLSGPQTHCKTLPLVHSGSMATKILITFHKHTGIS